MDAADVALWTWNLVSLPPDQTGTSTEPGRSSRPCTVGFGHLRWPSNTEDLRKESALLLSHKPSVSNTGICSRISKRWKEIFPLQHPASDQEKPSGFCFLVKGSWFSSKLSGLSSYHLCEWSGKGQTLAGVWWPPVMTVCFSTWRSQRAGMEKAHGKSWEFEGSHLFASEAFCRSIFLTVTF